MKSPTRSCTGSTATIALLLLLTGCISSPGSPAPTSEPGDRMLETSTGATMTPEPATVSPSATATEIDTATPQATPTTGELPAATPEIVRIEFEAGGTGATLEGTLQVGETERYVLHAFAGQIMRVYVEPEGAILRIYGESGTELKSQDDLDPFWRGELPATQDYFIEVAHSAEAIGPWDRPLLLSITINPLGQELQWIDYRDGLNGFALRYSDYFATGEPPPEIPPMKGEPVFSLRFTGSEYFQKTNLGDVYFILAVSEDAEILSNCTAPAVPQAEQPLDPIEVDGVPFQRAELGDVAAGNLYDLRVHRALHAGACYEIVFFIHSSSIGAYPVEFGIVEFDLQGILDHLGSVLNTVQFIES